MAVPRIVTSQEVKLSDQDWSYCFKIIAFFKLGLTKWTLFLVTVTYLGCKSEMIPYLDILLNSAALEGSLFHYTSIFLQNNNIHYQTTVLKCCFPYTLHIFSTVQKLSWKMMIFYYTVTPWHSRYLSLSYPSTNRKLNIFNVKISWSVAFTGY